MPYLNSFDNWDPWGEDKLPDSLPWSLKDVRDRACKILAGRNQLDLQQATKSVYLMNIRAHGMAAIETIKQMEAEGKTEKYSSDFNTIRFGVENLDLSEFPLFSDARSADYLAVFALAAIGDLLILQSELESQDPSTPPPPFEYGPLTTELSAAATEAVAYAEQLIRESTLVKKSRAETGAKGGKKRSGKFKPLRNECLLRATLHQNAKSALQASRLVHASLEPEWLAMFESDDSEQHVTTISRWLLSEFQFHPNPSQKK